MTAAIFIAPGFAWIDKHFANVSLDALGDQTRFIPYALEIVQRMCSLEDDLSETLAACVRDPRLFQSISVVDVFASREIIVYANDAANLVIEINLWRQTRSTAVHQHIFYGATGVLAGEATEILYAPDEWRDFPPDALSVVPIGVLAYSRGDAFPVYAASEGQAGAIHKVLHEHPMTVTVVCRAGFPHGRYNSEFSFETGRRIDASPQLRQNKETGVASQILKNLSGARISKHTSRAMLDLADLAIACGKENVFDAPDLKVFRDLCTYVRNNLHSRKPALTALEFSQAFAQREDVPFFCASETAEDEATRRNTFADR